MGRLNGKVAKESTEATPARKGCRSPASANPNDIAKASLFLPSEEFA